MAVQPIHFGWFAGLWSKFAFGLLGLAMCVVTSTGIHIWLAKRREKGLPSPGWERMWLAIEWGQPCALAATAVVLAVAPIASFAAQAWCMATVSIFVSAHMFRSTSDMRASLRLILGVLFIGLVVANVGRWGALPHDIIAIELNMIFAITGLALLMLVARSRPPSGVENAL